MNEYLKTTPLNIDWSKEWSYSNPASGYSPTISQVTTAEGVEVTITDKDGAHTFFIRNGKNGHVDPAEIEQAIADYFAAHPIIPGDIGARFPNATIVGEPLIVGSNVSQFSSADYMIFPFILDVRGKPFTTEFTFRTGADVATQQNILDSRFGLALAVRNGRGIMALSNNGTSWDIGVVTGSTPIEPNSVYHARLTWDGTAYVGSLSTDGQTYTEDMRLASSLGLHPETIYIGASPDIFGAGTSHPFGGGIDMGESRVTVAGLEVWYGMDDAGLASRANVSLSNLDAMGENRFTELKKDLAVKLNEPASAQVGQFFRVASIDADGHYVLEAVDAPSGGVTDVMAGDKSLVSEGVADIPVVQTGNNGPGLVKVSANLRSGFVANTYGELAINRISDSQFANRDSGNANGIRLSDLDKAVKAAMCDGKGAAWTAEEQAAAQARIGILSVEEVLF